MFSFLNRHLAAVLLLTLMQSVFVSVNTQKYVETPAKAIFSSMQVPWIEGIRSAVRYSESPCAEEITALSRAIESQEMWALEMLDASSKIQSGILSGNVVDLGIYDQCVAVDDKHEDINVRGKHCMVTLGFETLTLTYSICVPSSCNETQALHMVSSVMKNLLVNNSSVFEASGATCARIGSEDFTLSEILTIVFFSAVFAFIIVCTICDFVKRSQPEKRSVGTLTTLAKFSLYTNALVILSTRVKPGTMPAIDGIRFLSACWIVIWHRYVFSKRGPLINSLEYPRWSSSWSAVWVQMATFAPDNFFLISGFLVSYSFFKSMRSGGRFSLPKMYLHRYIRLTPFIGVVTLFVTVLFHRIGNGPLWKGLTPILLRGCRENWWINFLYIQNILRPRNICLVYSWYLAAEMQLFWISPFILYPLHRWPKYGLGVWSLFLLASIVIPTLVVGLNGYSIVGPTRDAGPDRFIYYYIKSYTRAFPYLLGILLGHDIATKKRRRFTQVAVVFNWIAICILVILCSLAIYRLRNANIEYNLAFEIMCAVLIRPCWSIAMVWIIYACTQGHGGVVAKFLSLPIFLPLSRLSYGIYLVHIVIRVFRMGTSVTPGIFLGSEILDSYLGDLVLSIGVSGVITLFFESPAMVLQKILKDSSPQRERVTRMQNDELCTETVKDVRDGATADDA